MRDPLRPPLRLSGGSLALIASAAILVGLLLAFNLRRGTDVELRGRVERILPLEKADGAIIRRIFVRIDDGRLIVLNLGFQNNCVEGARVAVVQSQTLIAKRYQLAYDSCTVPK